VSDCLAAYHSQWSADNVTKINGCDSPRRDMEPTLRRAMPPVPAPPVADDATEKPLPSASELLGAGELPDVCEIRHSAESTRVTALLLVRVAASIKSKHRTHLAISQWQPAGIQHCA